MQKGRNRASTEPKWSSAAWEVHLVDDFGRSNPRPGFQSSNTALGACLRAKHNIQLNGAEAITENVHNGSTLPREKTISYTSHRRPGREQSQTMKISDYRRASSHSGRISCGSLSARAKYNSMVPDTVDKFVARISQAISQNYS